jgi:hypothetical protein
VRTFGINIDGHQLWHMNEKNIHPSYSFTVNFEVIFSCSMACVI